MNVTVASIEIKVQTDILNPAGEADIIINFKGTREQLINAFKIAYLRHDDVRSIINEAGKRANAERAKEGN